jgi:hypothetical protein
LIRRGGRPGRGRFGSSGREGLMAKRKDTAGKDDEPQARGRPGPPSATPNEERRATRDKDAPAEPKVSKHDANKDDSWGGGLH